METSRFFSSSSSSKEALRRTGERKRYTTSDAIVSPARVWRTPDSASSLVQCAFPPGTSRRSRSLMALQQPQQPQLQMSWQPSLLSQKRKTGPPLGFRNLGNSCYLNSVLQCLTYTPPLANFCLRSLHSSCCTFSIYPLSALYFV